MYKNHEGRSIYKLWLECNPQVEMPPPMRRYDPATAAPETLTFQEYQ